MWAPLLEPGLALLSGRRPDLRAFHQEIAHFAIHHRDGHVLWCDGDHGFDPYDFAELNLVSGFAADDGAERLLVKRCMTPFQWDSVLTQHLGQKLATVPASMVLAAPYDALFSTDELSDWEQEDYVRYSLKHLAGLAKRHAVPILLSIDMGRWWRTHPVLAQIAQEAVPRRWQVALPGGRFRVEGEGLVLDPYLARVVTLFDFAEIERAVEVPVPLPPVRSVRVD